MPAVPKLHRMNGLLKEHVRGLGGEFARGEQSGQVLYPQARLRDFFQGEAETDKY